MYSGFIQSIQILAGNECCEDKSGILDDTCPLSCLSEYVSSQSVSAGEGGDEAIDGVRKENKEDVASITRHAEA